jgi:hypothetical protein
MRQKYPKYPANSGGSACFGSPLTLANIERIDLALNFFRNLLEQIPVDFTHSPHA